jgi:hypothetical protein
VKVVGEEETLDAIIAGKSIARYGDGELNNLEGKKCVPQLVQPGLTEELRKVIASNSKDCLVGIPYISPDMPPEKVRSWTHYMPRFAPFLNKKATYYSAFITRPDSAPWIGTAAYFDKVQSLWKGKEVALVWGGYRSLYPDFLRKTGAAKVHSVIVSYEDAYAQIDDIERRVLATGVATVLLCAGPTATCLAYRLSLRGVQAIDLGHIGLFWRHAQQEHTDIAIAPVAVLPKVEETKAQIKEYGNLVEFAPIGASTALHWPKVDVNPHETFKRELERAKRVPRALGTKEDTPQWNTCVFVGAGPGPAVKEVSKHFDRVFAFEPDFGMFGALRRNLPRLGITNVAFYKECVGDVVGTTRMRPGKSAGQWNVDINGPASVMQTTIDAMELDDCDCILTDVDDATHERIVAGATATLKRHIVSVLRL